MAIQRALQTGYKLLPYTSRTGGSEMHKTWIVSFLGLALLLIVIPRTLVKSSQPRLYPDDYNPQHSWNGIEMTFQTTSVEEGEQRWQYVRDDNGRWRLDILEGRHAGNTTIFAKETLYEYHFEADHLIVIPYSHQVEASFLLRPELPLVLSDPKAWSVQGRTTIQGISVVHLASSDKSEQLWIDHQRGIPVRYTNATTVWELLSARLGETHHNNLFAAPRATQIDHLPKAEENE